MKLSLFQIFFLITLFLIFFQRSFFLNVLNFINSFLRDIKKRNSIKK